MIRYELKKIFERRLNIIAMLSGYLLIGICVFSFISKTSFYDKATDSYIEGLEAVHLCQERTRSQTSVISEEYMTQLIKDIQSHGLNLDSDDAYVEVIRPLGDIYYFAAKNYTDMRENNIDGNTLARLGLSDGAGFYQQRMKKITEYLNLDFSYGNYKEAEKEYWIKKAESTSTPFAWGDKSVMNMVWDTVAIGCYLWFVIVICVSPVFSSEHESGAASLLLTTKYGKDRLIWCKSAASLLFATGYLSVGILLGVGAIGLLLGFPGAGLPVQLWNSVIPGNLTVGWACAESFAILLLIGIAITLVLLCFSSHLRSSLATLVIGIALIIAPAFFPMSKESGLWNHINFLFPVRAANLKDVLGSFVSYTVGNHVIPYLEMIIIVYTLTGIIALLLVRKGFVKTK